MLRAGVDYHFCCTMMARQDHHTAQCCAPYHSLNRRPPRLLVLQVSRHPRWSTVIHAHTRRARFPHSRYPASACACTYSDRSLLFSSPTALSLGLANRVLQLPRDPHACAQAAGRGAPRLTGWPPPGQLEARHVSWILGGHDRQLDHNSHLMTALRSGHQWICSCAQTNPAIR